MLSMFNQHHEGTSSSIQAEDSILPPCKYSETYLLITSKLTLLIALNFRMSNEQNQNLGSVATQKLVGKQK